MKFKKTIGKSHMKLFSEHYKNKGYMKRSSIYVSHHLNLDVLDSFHLVLTLSEQLDSHDREPLKSMLSSYQFAREVTVRCQKLNDKTVDLVLNALAQSLPELTKLCIECTGNGFTTQIGLSRIAAFVKANGKITSLTLNNIATRQPGVPHPLLSLLSALPENQITHFDLQNNQLESTECLAIVSANTNAEINLKYNDIGPDFMRYIEQQPNLCVEVGPVFHFTAQTDFSRLFKELYNITAPENDFYRVLYLLNHIRHCPEFDALCEIILANTHYGICKSDTEFAQNRLLLQTLFEFKRKPFQKPTPNSFRDVQHFLYQFATLRSHLPITKLDLLARIYLNSRYCLALGLSERALVLFLNSIQCYSKHDTDCSKIILMFCADLVAYLNHHIHTIQSAEYDKTRTAIDFLLSRSGVVSDKDREFMLQLKHLPIAAEAKSIQLPLWSRPYSLHADDVNQSIPLLNNEGTLIDSSLNESVIDL